MKPDPSTDDLRQILGPIVEAYAHLSDALAELAEHYNSESFERFEVDEIGEASAFYSWAKDRDDRWESLVAGVRKGIIALSAAQAIAEDRGPRLPYSAFSTIITRSGSVARTMLTAWDERTIGKVGERQVIETGIRLRSISDDLTALIATAGHRPIPPSAFLRVGESKGALVPLLETVEDQLACLLADLPRLLRTGSPKSPEPPSFDTA